MHMMIEVLIPQDRPFRGSQVPKEALGAAISVHAEQCASICATVVWPHVLPLAGPRSSIRFLISLPD